MTTNYSNHNNKAKRYRKQMEQLQDKYPLIDLKSPELRRDINKMHDLMIKVVQEEVEAKCCKSDDPDDMCSNCTCWKNSRMICS